MSALQMLAHDASAYAQRIVHLGPRREPVAFQIAATVAAQVAYGITLVAERKPFAKGAKGALEAHLKVYCASSECCNRNDARTPNLKGSVPMRVQRESGLDDQVVVPCREIGPRERGVAALHEPAPRSRTRRQRSSAASRARFDRS